MVTNMGQIQIHEESAYEISSLHGFKDVGGVKSVTEGQTKSNLPPQLFQNCGHKEKII